MISTTKITAWHELAADRSAWRKTLALGHPPDYAPQPPSPPLALARPRRAAAAATNARIDVHLTQRRGGVAPPPLQPPPPAAVVQTN